MKRFKTKQELKRDGKLEYWHRAFDGLGMDKAFGEPTGLRYSDLIITADPHPFDSMDIKVRVTPKQSKKLQKKAKAMGYQDEKDLFGSHYTDHGNDIILYIRQGKVTAWNPTTTTAQHRDHTELTYKQFMSGTVPKKKEFKVRDWVEVISQESRVSFSIRTYHNIGHVGEIQEVTGQGNCIIDGYHVPKENLKHTTKPKDHPITADEIIKPEVIERLKEVTILSIKACKSIKDVEEAYTSLQNTIKEL